MDTGTGLTFADIFDGLSCGTVWDFEALVHKRSYASGTTLFNKGEPCQRVFWVFSGQVTVSVPNDAGRSAVLYMARPGELLGLKEALCSEEYGTTVRTEGPSEVNFVNCADFSDFLSTHPDAAFCIVQKLSDRLGITLTHLRLASSVRPEKPPN